MKAVITRLGYCPECFKKGSPKADQPFAVFGDTSKEFFVKFAKSGRCHKGFTPHFFLKVGISTDSKQVFYKKLCCMHGCGTDCYREGSTIVIELNQEKWSKILSINIRDWNALVFYRDESMKI